MNMFRTCFVPLVTVIISTSSQVSPVIIASHVTAFAIMPKHALNSNLESPETKKKKRDSDGSTKDSGSKNMEKPKRSVREKLVAGIVIGLTKAQNQQQQQQPAQDSQSFYEVAALQDSLDKKFHVNPRILQNLNSPSQSQNMMIPKEEDDEDEYQHHLSGKRGIITDHFRRRSDQR